MSSPLPGPRDLGDAGEGLRIAHGDVGQNLAIEGHACLLETAHELAVGQAVQAGGSVEPNDPQAAHLPLALLATDIRIGHCVKQRLARRLDQLRTGAPAPFGCIEQTLVSLVRGDAALDACHFSVSLLKVGQQATNLLLGRPAEDGLARVAPRAARRLDLEVVATPGLDAHDLAAARDAEALLGSLVALHLWHRVSLLAARRERSLPARPERSLPARPERSPPARALGPGAEPLS